MDPRQEFGRLLRKARDERGLNQRQLAPMVQMSQSALSRLESDDSPIPDGVSEVLDQIFGTDGKFKRAHEAVIDSSFPALYQRRMSAERQAVAIAEWSPTVVPGLFQTSGYARAIIGSLNPRASEREVERGVTARLARLGVLDTATPPDVRLILCESVVRRRVGGPEVMREQLSSLLKHSTRPTVQLRILPLDAEPHAFVDYPVSILTDPKGVTIVCGETYRTAGVVEDPLHVREALRAYDEITGEALSTRQSASLITTQMEQL